MTGNYIIYGFQFLAGTMGTKQRTQLGQVTSLDGPSANSSVSKHSWLRRSHVVYCGRLKQRSPLPKRSSTGEVGVSEPAIGWARPASIIYISPRHAFTARGRVTDRFNRVY